MAELTHLFMDMENAVITLDYLFAGEEGISVQVLNSQVPPRRFLLSKNKCLLGELYPTINSRPETDIRCSRVIA